MIYAHPKLSKARNPYWAKNYLRIILGHQASASSALLIPTEVSQHLFGYCQTTNAQVSIIEAILVFWSLLLDNDSILLARGEKHNSTSVQPMNLGKITWKEPIIVPWAMDKSIKPRQTPPSCGFSHLYVVLKDQRSSQLAYIYGRSCIGPI